MRRKPTIISYKPPEGKKILGKGSKIVEQKILLQEKSQKRVNWKTSL